MRHFIVIGLFLALTGCHAFHHHGGGPCRPQAKCACPCQKAEAAAAPCGRPCPAQPSAPGTAEPAK